VDQKVSFNASADYGGAAGCEDGALGNGMRSDLEVGKGYLTRTCITA
jgi:hypothetical protein